jgi:sialate O-acetylesterase
MNGDREIFLSIFAQIAPYNYAQFPAPNRTEKNNSAYLRDAQRKSAITIPNSGIVVLMDNGEELSIHPADKETVGKRFAYLALGNTYQWKGFAYQSPHLIHYLSMEVSLLSNLKMFQTV